MQTALNAQDAEGHRGRRKPGTNGAKPYGVARTDRVSVADALRLLTQLAAKLGTYLVAAVGSVLLCVLRG
jgi:hypothetical protein